MPLKSFAIIVSAGRGLRMGTEIRKQYLILDGVPVLSRTLMAFDRCSRIDGIILVIPEDDHDFCTRTVIRPFSFNKTIQRVSGGPERQDSVMNGLARVRSELDDNETAMVLVHDGVRPFIHDRLIHDCLDGAEKHGACIPGLNLTDTVKQTDGRGRVEKTLNRDVLYGAQTPQAFRSDLLFSAFEHARKTGFTGTDDASLVEHFGHPVVICPGSKLNIKLTTPDDLIIGEQILKRMDHAS